MRLSKSHVQALRKILLEEHGIDMTDEAAQQTGLSIIRLVVAKLQQNPETLKAKLNEHDRVQKDSSDI